MTRWGCSNPQTPPHPPAIGYSTDTDSVGIHVTNVTRTQLHRIVDTKVIFFFLIRHTRRSTIRRFSGGFTIIFHEHGNSGRPSIRPGVVYAYRYAPIKSGLSFNINHIMSDWGGGPPGQNPTYGYPMYQLMRPIRKGLQTTN